uniref:Uncharacterized protein n=1 Tax=Rhizophora mucronata TaxID=61149 RepID=A0A2P2KKU6_RHIMU
MVENVFLFGPKRFYLDHSVFLCQSDHSTYLKEKLRSLIKTQNAKWL